MKNVNLKLVKLIDDETKIGQSHVLGCPDCPVSYSENAVFFNDEVFVAQFNLAEFELDLLPNKGMLYFFIQARSLPLRGIVRYSEDVSNLERIDFNVDSGVDANFELEYEVKICDDGHISLLSDKKYNYVAKDEVVLFAFNPVDYQEIDFLKGLVKELVYVIKRSDLEALDFSKAHLNVYLEG